VDVNAAGWQCLSDNQILKLNLRNTTGRYTAKYSYRDNIMKCNALCTTGRLRLTGRLASRIQIQTWRKIEHTHTLSVCVHAVALEANFDVDTSGVCDCTSNYTTLPVYDYYQNCESGFGLLASRQSDRAPRETGREVDLLRIFRGPILQAGLLWAHVDARPEPEITLKIGQTPSTSSSDPWGRLYSQRYFRFERCYVC
jgi:hypothetical protein